MLVQLLSDDLYGTFFYQVSTDILYSHPKGGRRRTL